MNGRKVETTKMGLEKRHRISLENENTDMGKWIAVLPCLNCGKEAVIVSIIFTTVCRDTIHCQSCADVHYLSVKPTIKGFEIQYHRYNLRYPLECYDDYEEPPFVKVWADGDALDEGRETFSGPIEIYPRKRRFKKSEKSEIWNSTRGVCHICGKKWRLEDHKRDGWHVDHVIPHDSGGRRTEKIKNFRVACAKCNLKKGKGYSEKRVKIALQNLIEKFFIESRTSKDAWPTAVYKRE